MNKDNFQSKGNKNVLQDDLKSGIEYLSGLSMDGVKVHYNQEKPEIPNNIAHEEGTSIHLAPGQDKNLPHEAWHVVQQKQGEVKPTKQIKEETVLNENNELEKEADAMGNKTKRK